MCLLTLHFLSRDERIATITQLHRRLKPGAPFVVAHSSFPQAGNDRSRWLNRYANFAVHSGADPAQVGNMRSAVEQHLHLFSPEDDEAMLRDAGFSDLQLFYAAFTWRGWLAHA